MDEPYKSFNSLLREKFNYRKVIKIPVNAGFLCPNKNGKLSETGCVFCDAYGSGPIKSFDMSISAQIEKYIKNHPGCKYIAYYQAHSNTYAPVSELKQKYEIIFNYEDIVGLFIGTRPDCIADEVYPLLERLNEKTYLSVELGLQSIHAGSLRYLNRNHTYENFLETFSKLKDRNIDVVVHLIIGVPGENNKKMLDTVTEMNRIKPAGIKFHLLHILDNSPLHEEFKKEKLRLLEMEEYTCLMALLLENLDPEIVIHRLTGERDREIFIAPRWAQRKINVINSIKAKMKKRNTYQGRLFKSPT
jgi:radical SAM protein (TIGR01212 family)